jgi:hypothetical protein
LILGAIQDGGACSEIAAVLVTHLVLPFEDAVPTDLVRTVVTKCQSKRSRVELDRSIIGLIEGVATKAFPSNRRLWLRTIAIGLSDAGVSSPQLHRDLEDAPSKDDGTTYPHVVLRSGIRLGEDEVRLKLHSLSDLLELIGDIDKVEYFHWEEVLGPIVSSCSREQVEQIRRELAQFRPGPLATCLFAERLAQLGLDAEARTMAESVLDQSLPTGWDRWYDGGSRLKALKTLAGLDPKYWRPKALARLVEDYLTEFRNPSAVLRNLDDICEIIFEDVPINGVWREIAEHVYQLYEFTQLTEVGPEIPGGAESISHAEMLIRATISTAVVPIVEIRESAHEAMCRMVEGGMNDEYTQKCVLRMMKSDQYDLRIAGLSVLDSVASIRHEFVQGCSDLIKGLSVSPNYRERLIAVEISRRIGIAAREISQDRRKLPSTYQFVFAHIDASKEVFPAEGLPQGSALPDTKDEVQLVRLFLPTIEWLSSLSGIPKENLLHRASRLMHTLVPEALWNKQAEEGVQSWEAGAGLGIAYLRPRPRVALLASSYVVGELVDSGAIPAGAQEALWDALAPHDRLLSRLLPTSTTPSLWWIARLDDGERLLKEGFQHGPPQRGQALSALGGESPGPGQRGWVRAGLGRSSAEG